MKFRIYHILLFAFIITSCSKEEDNIIKMDTFYPLSVGSKWTYEIFKANDGLTADEHIFSVVKDTLINIQTESYKAFVVESFSTSGEEPKWNIFQGHDADGNLIQYGARFQDAVIIDKSVQYKKDAEIGDFWNYNHPVHSEGKGIKVYGNEMRCVQLDTIIHTKAGTFSCIKFYDTFKRRENANEKNFYFINPKVGLIKYSLIWDDEVLLELSLKEYNIAD